MGCGLYRDAGEGYRRLAVRERVLQPDPARAAAYRPLFAEYKRIAGTLGAAYSLPIPGAEL